MKYFFALLFFVTFYADAGTLETDNYVIDIESQCPEGYVICDNVLYKGTHKTTKSSITLRGETMHTTCADGITPCRFVGYRFKNGNITYLVYSEGILEVTRNDETLLREKGQWHDASEKPALIKNADTIPVCNYSHTLPIELLPGRKNFRAVAQYDGNSCPDSLLTISIVDQGTNTTLFDTQFSFSTFIMHDSPEADQLKAIAKRKADSILNDMVIPQEWPAFKFTSTSEKLSLNYYTQSLITQIEELKEKSKNSPPAEAARLKDKASELMSTVYEMEDYMPFEYQITKDHYDRLIESNALLYGIHYGEMIPIYFAFNKTSQRIIVINNQGR